MSPVTFKWNEVLGMWSFYIPIPPVPASRPRVTKWGTYYGKNYTTFRKRATALTPNLPSDFPLTGPLSVVTEIHAVRPRTTKKQWPRGDNDNFEKGIWDAITAWGVWGDDDQIVKNVTTKQYAIDVEPHIVVHITRSEKHA